VPGNSKRRVSEEAEGAGNVEATSPSSSVGGAEEGSPSRSSCEEFLNTDCDSTDAKEASPVEDVELEGCLRQLRLWRLLMASAWPGWPHHHT